MMVQICCDHLTGSHLVSKEGQPCYGKANQTPRRRLVLVDIENYCGKGVLFSEDVKAAKGAICDSLEINGDDLIVIGTSHGRNCLVSGTEWVGPRQVLRHGHNGADIALIEALREYKLKTFSSLVIVSGDGIFSKIASIVRSQQKRVIVVSEAARLSRRLALVASEIRHALPQAHPVAS